MPKVEQDFIVTRRRVRVAKITGSSWDDWIYWYEGKSISKLQMDIDHKQLRVLS
jgi:hypothetical protein